MHSVPFRSSCAVRARQSGESTIHLVVSLLYAIYKPRTHRENQSSNPSHLPEPLRDLLSTLKFEFLLATSCADLFTSNLVGGDFHRAIEGIPNLAQNGICLVILGRLLICGFRFAEVAPREDILDEILQPLPRQPGIGVQGGNAPERW